MMFSSMRFRSQTKIKMNKTLLILKLEYLKRVKKIIHHSHHSGSFHFCRNVCVDYFISVQDDKQERIFAVYDESSF